jgi:uncharacterized damage-inducible protein DinB
MNLQQQIAQQYREVHSGRNWTWSDMKEHLMDVTWQQAITEIPTFNTIAVLVCHMHYYTVRMLNVLTGARLEEQDEDSFTHPPINNQHDWEGILKKVWTDAERLAQLIAQMPEEQLWATVAERDYNYYTFLHGIIQHNHYHLGQIVFLKKMIAQGYGK